MRSPLRAPLAASLLAALATQATAQTLMPLPPFSTTFSAPTLTRGYWFQSPANIIITGLQVPDESNHGLQNVEVFRLPAAPPPYPGTGSGVQVFYRTGVPSSQVIAASILVNTGEYIGILGACGDATTMRNSYSAAPGPYASTLLGQPVTLDRFLTQTNIVSTGGNQPYSQESGFSIGRVNLYYTAQSGLFASFSASTTSGPTPLAVNFTDTSFSSAPGGVQTWAWDLNGDTIVDSNLRNPSFTYTTCGYYTVSLTVTDSQHPPSTSTRSQYIQADPQLLVQASFTSATTGTPLQLQFTDTSAGSPTAWIWDLNGDSIPDSAAQNPTFTYATGGLYNATLTAMNACGANTVTQQVYVLGNDDCAGNLALALGNNGPFSNIGATTNPLDPTWPCAGGGADVWFRYTASMASTLFVDLCGSGYDTAVEIFTGTCGALSSVGCNDDSCGLQSTLQVPAAAGQGFLIRVGGYFGATGSFSVNVSEIPALTNDECVNAIPVAVGQNGPFTNVGATDNPLDPVWPCAAGGSDVWFVMTVRCSQNIEINTCRGSTYDTALQILSGTCGSLVPVVCNDDSCGLLSSVSFQAVPGTNFYIRAGGFAAGQGTFTLDINVSGNGGFNTVLPGCGQATLSASGSPNLGGAVNYQMSNVAGTPVLWLGLLQFNVPLCPPAGCQLGTTFDVTLPFGAASFGGPVPCDPTLRNRTFYIQGLDLGGVGGCPSAVFGVGVSTTEVIATTVG